MSVFPGPFTLEAAEAVAGPGAGSAVLRLVAAAQWLDAEDATMRQVQAWAMQHDAVLAVRLASALGWWWFLRGRLAGEYPVLRQAAELAGAGSGGWHAAQFWLGWTALSVPDLDGALGYLTTLRDAAADRPPGRELAIAPDRGRVRGPAVSWR